MQRSGSAGGGRNGSRTPGGGNASGAKPLGPAGQLRQATAVSANLRALGCRSAILWVRCKCIARRSAFAFPSPGPRTQSGGASLGFQSKNQSEDGARPLRRLDRESHDDVVPAVTVTCWYAEQGHGRRRWPSRRTRAGRGRCRNGPTAAQFSPGRARPACQSVPLRFKCHST